MSFKAQCPYCRHVIAASQEAMGASARCPKCGDFFTVAPIEEEAALPAQGPAARLRAKPTAAKQQPIPTAAETGDEVATETVTAEATAPSPPEPSSLQPAGVIALFLGGLGLLAASFPAWKWLTVPLSIIGVVIGGSAIAWVHVQRTPGIVVSIAGAAVSFVVLFVAALLPGLLGPTFSTPRSTDPPPAAIQAIPLQLVPGSAPGTDADGYIDAARAALQQGTVRVQVVDVSTNPATKKQAAAITIRLRVQLFEDSKELISKGLAFSGASGEAVQLALKDASGTSYTQKDAKTVIPDEKEARLSAFPIAVSDEVIRFEPAPPGGQDLRLDVPSAAWGGSAVFRFLIPKSMIRTP